MSIHIYQYIRVMWYTYDSDANDNVGILYNNVYETKEQLSKRIIAELDLNDEHKLAYDDLICDLHMMYDEVRHYVDCEHGWYGEDCIRCGGFGIVDMPKCIQFLYHKIINHVTEITYCSYWYYPIVCHNRLVKIKHKYSFADSNPCHTFSSFDKHHRCWKCAEYWFPGEFSKYIEIYKWYKSLSSSNMNSTLLNTIYSYVPLMLHQ